MLLLGGLKGRHVRQRGQTILACVMRNAPRLPVRLRPLLPLLCREESKRKVLRRKVGFLPMLAKCAQHRGRNAFRRRRLGKACQSDQTPPPEAQRTAKLKFTRAIRGTPLVVRGMRVRLCFSNGQRSPREPMRKARQRVPPPCVLPHLATNPRMPPPMMPT